MAPNPNRLIDSTDHIVIASDQDRKVPWGDRSTADRYRPIWAKSDVAQGRNQNERGDDNHRMPIHIL